MPDDLAELERLRHKKMAQMMKRIETQKKQEESMKEKEEGIDRFLSNLLMPLAFEYYKTQIVPQRPLIANRIIELLQYLVSTGSLRTKLTKEELIIVERKLAGIGPSIKIKRSGKEYTDIASELTKKK